MNRTKVVIVDMQPITPAIGGGRQRLLGLFHGLGPEIDATYVGSYDWRGEQSRDQQLTPVLREICVPLSGEHHAAAEEAAEKVGKVVIDATFSSMAALSPEWMQEARRWIEWADIIVFEHPWAYSPLAPFIRPGQLLVYDAQNVESFLKAESLGMDGMAKDVISEVIRNEYELLLAADLVVCCSEEDANQFCEIFEIGEDKLRIAPNGAFTRTTAESVLRKREEARKRLLPDNQRPLAVFMGSQYGPNVDAGRFIVDELAPACPGIDFVLVGSVLEALPGDRPENVIMTGVVSDELRDAWLLRADVALNPMQSGSGTNVKMFDYLAAGLPVLTTSIGARGICDESTAPAFMRVVHLWEFAAALPAFLKEQAGSESHLAAWAYVDRRFSWEAISRGLGRVLVGALDRKASQRNDRKTVMVLSTWNIRCGIGEYSAYLADGLREEGHDVVVYGNRLAGHDPAGFELDLKYPVVRGWTWDNVAWRDSHLDQARYEAALERVKPDYVIVQHHTAYMPQYDFENAIRLAKQAGAQVVVEAHDARNLSRENAIGLVSAGASLAVHSEETRSSLPAQVRAASGLIHHPTYSPKELRTDNLPGNGDPVIAGFGFLRPYKGVHIAIEALALVREKFPNATYRGWHSLYPGEESENYYRECLELVKARGLEGAVSIETAFLPIDDVVSALASTSIVLLPYQPSSEGASGAANIAIAAGRPLVVSSSDIFRSLENACIRVPEHSAAAYANQVISLLGDETRMRECAERAKAWARDHSFGVAARKLLALAA